MNWRDTLGALGEQAEAAFTRLAHRLDRRIGKEPLAVVPYRGYGTADRAVLRWRVLEAPAVTPSGDNDSLWANLVNTYRRFETDEVPDAVVEARFGGNTQQFTSDAEGYVAATLLPHHPLPTDQAWHSVELTLLAPAAQAPVRATGQVFVPQPAAQFGVISDIDDTVVRTNATSLVKMARTVFLGNARTRLPFPGVAALYRALHAGAPGPFVNPIFYVSSSPWNLYDMLVDFFELQQIPHGPLMLRDWGVSPNDLPFGHRTHKLAAIRELLDFYPTMPFLLIGDSGQEDPEIYAEVVRLYPNRIRAIYIRNIDGRPQRLEAIKALTEEVVAANCTLILADDTLAMAQHAAAQGWIAASALDDVLADKAADQGQPNAVEVLLDQGEAEVVDTPNAAQAAGEVEAAVEQARDEGDQPPTIVVEGQSSTDTADKSDVNG